MQNEGKKKKSSIWLTVLAFCILLEAGGYLIAQNLPTHNQTVQTDKSNTIVEDKLPDFSQEAITKRAKDAFQNVGLKLDFMRQAYQSWAIPYQSSLYENAFNVRTYNIKGDGSTNDTAAVQAILNSVPEKSTVFFPAGVYKINGPVYLSRELTICGEPNTVFDCSASTSSSVFQVNPQGSSESCLNNITITGIEFIGPGIESEPSLLYAKNVQNAKFTNLKIRDCGYAAILFENSSNCLVDKCVFDNIYHTKLGYGVTILNKCDNIYIRDCFFAMKGRHGITIGSKEANPTPDQLPRNVFISNNYFQNITDGSINVRSTAGQITISDNVFDNCNKGVRQLSGSTEITGNIMSGCNMGIVLHSDNMPHLIKNNTLINNRWEAIYVKCSNVQIINNNIEGPIACISSSSILIKGNYIRRDSQPIELTPADPTIIMESNFVENSEGLKPI